MALTIRDMHASEYGLLEDFLYEAIFLKEGESPPPRSVVQRPELRVYTENFGQKSTDVCLVAEVEGHIAGAVWARIMNDYGHIDGDTPSLAISLYKRYRNLGIGSRLLCEMLARLGDMGFSRVSLSVQKDNYAVRMYRKAGFKTVGENAEDYIMLCALR